MKQLTWIKTSQISHTASVSFNKFAPLFKYLSKPVDSIIRSEAFILTWINFQYVGGEKLKATADNVIYLEKPSSDKSAGFIVVNESTRNSKEHWQKVAAVDSILGRLITHLW